MPLNSPTVKVVVVSIKSFPSEAISVSVKIGSKVEVSGNNVGKSFVVIRLLLVEVSCTSVVGIGRETSGTFSKMIIYLIINLISTNSVMAKKCVFLNGHLREAFVKKKRV